MRRFAALAGLFIALTFAAPEALAERRLALVIGNDRYPNLPQDRQLRNAVNDARAMADTLRKLGFEIFGGPKRGQHGENVDRDEMIDRIDDLARAAQPGDVLFVFFAGHGVSIRGANMLLPSDVPAPRGLGAQEEDRYIRRAIAEGDIIKQLTRLEAKAVILVLDACRDNPIAAGGRSMGGARGLEQARFEIPAGAYFFSIYSAGFGQQALDRLGPADTSPNSVFTRVFTQRLRHPGWHIQEVASHARRDIRKLTLEIGYDQFLAYMDQLNEPIYLAGLPAGGGISRAEQDRRTAAQAERALSEGARPGQREAPAAVPADQLKTLLAAAAASREPAKRAALQMIADGGVREGAEALEKLAQAETAQLIAMHQAVQEERGRVAETWRQTGAVWTTRDVKRAIDAYARAAALDPGDFWTDVYRVRLHLLAGQSEPALEIAKGLKSKAKNERDRGIAGNELGNILLRHNDLAGALQAHEDGLESARRLAAANPRSALYQRDIAVSLNKVGDVLVRKNELDGALQRYEESYRIVQRLAAAYPKNVEAQRDVSVSLNKVGDIRRRRGDFEGALEYYRKGLEIPRRLYAADPSNHEAERDISVSLDKVGNVLLQLAKYDEALKVFEEALGIDRKLAARDPNETRSQRDLSISLNKMGDIMRRRNDLPGALKFYEESLSIRRRLAALDRRDAEAQRDVSVSLDNIGDVHLRRDDVPGALKAFQEALEIDRRIAALDRDDARAQRDLSIGLNKIAGILRRRDDLDGARKLYLESVEIRRRLAAAAPWDRGARRDVSVTLTHIGDVLIGLKDVPGARKAYEEALTLDRRQAAENPGDDQTQSDLAISLERLAGAQLRGNDRVAAMKTYDEWVALRRKRAAANLGSADRQEDLARSLKKVGDLRYEQRDLSGALAAYEEALVADRRRNAVEGGTRAQRDLVSTLVKIARVRQAQAQKSDACSYLQEALAILTPLRESSPESVAIRDDLAYVQKQAQGCS